MSGPPILTVRPAEADLASYTILACTAGHPLRRWLLGDASEYQLRTDAVVLARHAITHGVIDLFDDRAAIALWLYQPAPAAWPQLGAQTGLPPDNGYRARLRVLQATLPTAPILGHVQLLLLAADPGRREAGRATALLEHRHAQLDRAGLSATALAFDDLTHTLLTRRGYQVVHHTELGGGPCWTLHRPAARQEPA